jgi:hypothetical protein
MIRTRVLRWVGGTILVLGMATFLLAPAVAGAQTGPTTPYPTVDPTTTLDPCIGSGSIVTHHNGLTFCATSQVSSTSAQSGSGSLPFTGANIALMVGLGLAIVVGGVVLVGLARRPQASR